MRTDERTDRGSRLVVAGALVLGLGFGGLVDGIVLHEVLQWHNLISDVTAPEDLEALRRNVFWDGVFHAVTAALTAVGTAMVVLGGTGTGRTGVAPRRLAGLALVGWGAFHLLDQAVFHLALGLHDIRDDVADPALWNWGWTALGVLLAGVGARLARRG